MQHFFITISHDILQRRFTFKALELRVLCGYNFPIIFTVKQQLMDCCFRLDEREIPQPFWLPADVELLRHTQASRRENALNRAGYFEQISVGDGIDCRTIPPQIAANYDVTQ